ncbi:MAG: cysteine dioxygenase [Flammeovirgaceae bacterium]
MQSLSELVTALSEKKNTKYNDIMRSMTLPIHAFENHCSWSKDSYTRNCLAENEKFELILLCWEQGQITPIHDHGGEECWVKIIEGKFRETIYTTDYTTDETGELKVAKSIISTPNDTTYMRDFMGFHSIENLSGKRSMSLHLYAKPIRSCNIFDKKSRKFVNKNMVYNTISQLATH